MEIVWLVDTVVVGVGGSWCWLVGGLVGMVVFVSGN